MLTRAEVVPSPAVLVTSVAVDDSDDGEAENDEIRKRLQ